MPAPGATTKVITWQGGPGCQMPRPAPSFRARRASAGPLITDPDALPHMTAPAQAKAQAGLAVARRFVALANPPEGRPVGIVEYGTGVVLRFGKGARGSRPVGGFGMA